MDVSISVTITLDGSLPNAKKEIVEGDPIVMLGNYSTENSGFDWYKHSNSGTKVYLKDLVIYDKYDVHCLLWFLRNGFHVDMTKSHIGYTSLGYFIENLPNIDLDKSCSSLKLKLPLGSSASEMATQEKAKVMFKQKKIVF